MCWTGINGAKRRRSICGERRWLKMRRDAKRDVGFQRYGAALNFSLDPTIRLYRSGTSPLLNLEQEATGLIEFRIGSAMTFDVDLGPESAGGSATPVVLPDTSPRTERNPPLVIGKTFSD